MAHNNHRPYSTSLMKYVIFCLIIIISCVSSKDFVPTVVKTDSIFIALPVLDEAIHTCDPLMKPCNGVSLKFKSEDEDFIKKSCNIKITKSTAGADFAFFIIRKIVDYATKRYERYLEDTKKKSTALYSNNFHIMAKDMRELTCIVFARIPKDQIEKPQNDLVEVSQFDMLGVIKISPLMNSNNIESDAFYFEPIMIQVSRPVVKTLKKTNKVNLAIALAVGAIGKDQSGLPNFHAFGKGATSIPNVSLDKTYCSKNGINNSSQPSSCIQVGTKKSKILPFHDENNASVSFAISISETGYIGYDLDRKKEELEALKDASDELSKMVSDKLSD